MFVLLVTFSFLFQGVLAEQGEDLNDERKFVMDQLRILSEEMKLLKSTTAACTQKSDDDRMEEKKRLLLDDGQSSPDQVLNPDTTVGTAPIGSTYVRWGRTTCPDGAEVVYHGYAAGSSHTATGGGANHICLHNQPEWGYFDDVVNNGAKVYGSEYELLGYSNGGSSFFGKDVWDEDVPCAVCYVPRSSTIMIASRLTCPDPSWYKEYSGYLVAENQGHHRSEYICLDSGPEFIQGGAANDNGRLMYLVEASCGSLKCPPYVNGRELTCVVCSKQHRNNVHEH